MHDGVKLYFMRLGPSGCHRQRACPYIRDIFYSDCGVLFQSYRAEHGLDLSHKITFLLKKGCLFVNIEHSFQFGDR